VSLPIEEEISVENASENIQKLGDAVSPLEYAVRMILLGGRLDRSNMDDSIIIEQKS